MRWLALGLALAACADRPLDLTSDGGAHDLRGAIVDLASSDAKNACEQVLGYCAPGDKVEPKCKVGFTKSPVLTATGVCGLGICCVPLEH